jgi:ubiquinol oxidase
MTAECDLKKRCVPINFKDKVAFRLVKFMRFFADTFFKKRYGHRAVVLETIAAIPGMVGAMLKHFQCLRRIKDDHGWIRILLDEAENERMHLMTFIHISQPSFLERIIIILGQGIFGFFYFVLHILSPYTAHRLVGYLEEEAIVSYLQYLKEIKDGKIENTSAPLIAKEYWGLSDDARLTEVIEVVLKDECNHREVNHHCADELLIRSV